MEEYSDPSPDAWKYRWLEEVAEDTGLSSLRTVVIKDCLGFRNLVMDEWKKPLGLEELFSARNIVLKVFLGPKRFKRVAVQTATA